jgi:membrane protease YdiL (CAAX protease family)
VIRKVFDAVWSCPVSRFFVFLLILFVVLIFSEPNLVVLLGSLGMTNALGVFFCTEIYHLILCFGLLALFIRKVEHDFFRDFGFTMNNAAIDVLLGIGGATLLSVLTVGGMYALRVYEPIKTTSGQDLFLAAATLFFAAATEELIFRAYAFNIMEKHWGTIAAVIVSSVGFGFAHMLNAAGGASLIEKVQFCTFLSLEAGVSLAACYVFTRSLWMPIAAHWVWNFLEGPIFGTHVSGADFGQSWIDARIAGPDLLSGGKFGPEGSVVCLVVGTVGGVILLYLAARRNNLISFAEAQRRLGQPQEVIAEVPAD